MKETKEIKIEVPEGYIIDKENSSFEKIVFKKIEKELPKRWEDLEEIHGYAANLKSEIEETDYCKDYGTKSWYKSVFPTKEEAEASIALAQLCQLRDVYNEGYKPDWKDFKTKKYGLYYENDEITKGDFSCSRIVLYFKDEKIRDKFLENFRDLIEIAKPLL